MDGIDGLATSQALLCAIGLALLLAWYFSSAKPQARLVKERYGDGYARRGWGLPLLFGVLGMLALFVAAVVMLMVAALVFNRPLP